MEGELTPLQRRADLAEQAQTLGIEVVAPGEYSSTPPPATRARPSAASACWISSWALPAAGSTWAMPIATSTLTPTPFEHHGCLEHSLDGARHGSGAAFGQRVRQHRELVVPDAGDEV